MAVESHAREEEREMNLQVKKESNYVSNASQKCQYASIARLHWQFQSKTLVQMLLLKVLISFRMRLNTQVSEVCSLDSGY